MGRILMGDSGVGRWPCTHVVSGAGHASLMSLTVDNDCARQGLVV